METEKKENSLIYFFKSMKTTDFMDKYNTTHTKPYNIYQIRRLASQAWLIESVRTNNGYTWIITEPDALTKLLEWKH